MTLKMTADQATRLHQDRAAIERDLIKLITSRLDLKRLVGVADRNTEVISRITTVYHALATALGFAEAIMIMAGWTQERLVLVRENGVREGFQMVREHCSSIKDGVSRVIKGRLEQHWKHHLEPGQSLREAASQEAPHG